MSASSWWVVCDAWTQRCADEHSAERFKERVEGLAACHSDHHIVQADSDADARAQALPVRKS